MVKSEEVKTQLTFEKPHDPCFLGLRLQADSFDKHGQPGRGSLSFVSQQESQTELKQRRSVGGVGPVNEGR
jgi:hypothetical protein